MTKIDVTATATGSRIQITQLGDSKDEVVSKLNDCSSGACACSTEEFQKVQSIEILDKGDAVEVEVRTKTGESIDPSCVQECLTEPSEASGVDGACC